MIGRERELEELGEILSRTGEGEGGLVLLAGEAGVGKTRLAEAAVAAARLSCLSGVAAERGSSPYAPIAAVLREFLRHEPGGLSQAESLGKYLGAILPELGPATSVADRETLVTLTWVFIVPDELSTMECCLAVPPRLRNLSGSELVSADPM